MTKPPAGTITPGRWLVGMQVEPGAYVARAALGCYWERLRGFGGTTDSIRANDFVENDGRVVVEIRPGDAGFHADADCGNWRRRESGGTTASSGTTDPVRIEENYRRNSTTARRG